MSVTPPNQQIYIAAQRDMFRLAKRDHGLSATRLALLSGIPEPTLRTWTRDTAMPAWALAHLSQHLPDELVSLMFEINDRAVITVEPGDGDFHALAEAGMDYNVEYLGARRPESDGGTELTPREKAILREKARRKAAIARRVARAA